jgi:NADH-quinone oxidoreductase subunit J
MVDVVVFGLAALMVLAGAIGVIVSPNPVHSALGLILSFFGIAVLFVDLDAHFLAAVQVIVYAAAIVVLFLFVIMLLGVDQSDDITTEPMAGQRPLAAVAAVGLLGVAIATLFLTDDSFDRIVVGSPSFTAPLDVGAGENVRIIGRSLFTDYLFAFEITSVLLVIAVIGAVVLARTPKRRAGEELT